MDLFIIPLCSRLGWFFREVSNQRWCGTCFQGNRRINSEQSSHTTLFSLRLLDGSLTSLENMPLTAWRNEETKSSVCLKMWQPLLKVIPKILFPSLSWFLSPLILPLAKQMRPVTSWHTFELVSFHVLLQPTFETPTGPGVPTMQQVLPYLPALLSCMLPRV